MIHKLVLVIFLVSLTSLSGPGQVHGQFQATRTLGFQGFDYVVVIIMENNGRDATYGANCGGNCSYITQLADSYGIAFNYSGVAHPSVPNYLSLTSAGRYSRQPFFSDCSPDDTGCSYYGFNIVDRIEGSGRSWKAYMEDYPTSNCPLVSSTGSYTNTHNPFLYYQDIRNSTSRCHNIVRANPGTTGYLALPQQLFSDLGSVPNAANFMWLTPNLCDDGHNICAPLNNTVSQSNQYLSLVVPLILKSSLFRTRNAALFITWDEGSKCPNPGETYPKCTDPLTSIWAGPHVKNGYRSLVTYSHFSFVRTIEDAWQLSPLTGFDAAAPSMYEFFVYQYSASGHGRAFMEL